MPKIKSRKAAQKRFKLTKSGKVIRRKQNARHLRSAKSKAHQRRLKEPAVLSDKFAKKIKRML